MTIRQLKANAFLIDLYVNLENAGKIRA